MYICSISEQVANIYCYSAASHNNNQFEKTTKNGEKKNKLKATRIEVEEVEWRLYNIMKM